MTFPDQDDPDFVAGFSLQACLSQNLIKRIDLRGELLCSYKLLKAVVISTREPSRTWEFIFTRFPSGAILHTTLCYVSRCGQAGQPKQVFVKRDDRRRSDIIIRVLQECRSCSCIDPSMWSFHCGYCLNALEQD